MKTKDKKKLIIALVVLAGVILAGLGIWNYAASEGNFLRFNQQSNIEIQSTDTQIMDDGMNGVMDGGMNGVMDGGMNGIQ